MERPGVSPRREYGPPLPRAYELECGPGAVAALTGLTRREAARRLWPHRLFWLEEPSADVYGTPAFATMDVLLRFDWGIDWYAVEGALIADTVDVARQHARHAEARVRAGTQPLPRRAGLPAPMPREHGADDPDERAGDDPKCVEPPELEELAETAHPLSWWLARHRAGYWLYHVQLDGGRGAHVLATHGSEILSGAGPGMRDWPVLAAFRVHPPRPAARPAADPNDVAIAAPLAAATIHTSERENAKMTTTMEGYESVEELADQLAAGGNPDFDGETIAAAIVERLPGMLDEAEAAADVARETRARVDRAVRVLTIARQRGATSGIDLAMFRRLGLLEAGGEVHESRPVNAFGGEGRPVPHLFGSPAAQHRRFVDLVAVPAGLEERVRKRLEREARERWAGTPPAIAAQDIRDAVRKSAIQAAVTGRFQDEEGEEA